MNFLKKYRHILILIVICLVAVIFTATDWGVHIRDLWYDEAYTLFIIKASWAKLWWFIYQDVHQPTYYWIVKLRSYIAWQSDVAIRAFSILPYVAIIIYAYKIVYKVTSNKYISLLAAAAIAANPFIREYAQEARMYELLAAIWMFIFYKSIGLLQGERSKGQLRAIGLALMWGFFVHYFALIYGVGYLALLFVVLTIQRYKKTEKTLIHAFRKNLCEYRMIYVPVIVGLLISLPLIIHQYSSWYVGSVLQPMTLDFTIRSIGVFFLWHEQWALGIQPVNLLFSSQWSYIAWICFAIAWILSILYAFYHRRRHSEMFITLAGRGALFSVILVSVLKWNNMYVERYFVFLSPLLLLSFCLSAYHLKKYLGYIVAIIFIILPFGIQQPTYVKTGIREYMKTAIEMKVPAVAIKSDLDYLVGRYYLEYYNYTGNIYMRTADPRTPDRSIYQWTTPYILSLSELTGQTVIVSYQEEKEAVKLPYSFWFATMYLYTPGK